MGVLTDQKIALPLLEVNINSHRDRFPLSPIKLQMDWKEMAAASTQESGLGVIEELSRLGAWPVDGLLVGDCVWFQELVEPLLTSIMLLADGPPGHETQVILSHDHGHNSHKPGLDERIFGTIDLRLDGALRRVPMEDLNPRWRDDTISVWHGTLHTRRN